MYTCATNWQDFAVMRIEILSIFERRCLRIDYYVKWVVLLLLNNGRWDILMDWCECQWEWHDEDWKRISCQNVFWRQALCNCDVFWVFDCKWMNSSSPSIIVLKLCNRIICVLWILRITICVDWTTSVGSKVCVLGKLRMYVGVREWFVQSDFGPFQEVGRF